MRPVFVGVHVYMGAHLHVALAFQCMHLCAALHSSGVHPDVRDRVIVHTHTPAHTARER